jgi:hypothetical protein
MSMTDHYQGYFLLLDNKNLHESPEICLNADAHFQGILRSSKSFVSHARLLLDRPRNYCNDRAAHHQFGFATYLYILKS